MTTTKQTVVVLALITNAAACSNSTLEAKVDALSEQLTAAEGRVTALEAKLKALDGTTPQQISELAEDVSSLKTTTQGQETRLVAAEGQLSGIDFPSHEARLKAVEDKTRYMVSLGNPEGALGTLDEPKVIFSGANVYIQNNTQENANDKTATTNGLGNLIVGYNANTVGYLRNGSHNLVLGHGAGYTSYASIVAGERNRASMPYASVLGGRSNLASGRGAVVVAGTTNEAKGVDSVVVAGARNKAAGPRSVIVAGDGHSITLNSVRSAILGGRGPEYNVLEAFGVVVPEMTGQQDRSPL